MLVNDLLTAARELAGACAHKAIDMMADAPHAGAVTMELAADVAKIVARLSIMANGETPPPPLSLRTEGR